MQFGKHVPVGEHDRGVSSPMQTFARGLSIGGKRWKFQFDNGFGASVINDGYGRESGRYELAVLGPDGHLTYDTPVTSDVLGFLTEEEVSEALDKIQALTATAVEDEIKRRADAERDQRITALRAELAALEAEAGAR